MNNMRFLLFFQGWSPPGWHQIDALAESGRVSESSVAVRSALERSRAAFLRAGGAARSGQVGVWEVTHPGFGVPSSPPGPTPSLETRGD